MLAVALIATTTYGQTASQIAPNTFQPPASTQNNQITLSPEQGSGIPPGLDALFVRVGQVDVEGGLSAMATQTQAVVDSLTDKTVTAADIFAAAQRLEQAYAREGYILARVVVPEQDIADDSHVRLVVIDGYLQSIDTSRLPPQVRDHVHRILSSLVGRKGIRLAMIERKLMLAADTPGISLKSALTPGTEAGASILIIEASHQPISGFLSMDNSLGKALGRYQAGGGVDFNSVTGHGEKVYLRVYGDPVDGAKGFGGALPRNRAFNAGIALPVNDNGLSVIAEVTMARATPEPEASAPGFTSHFRRTSLRIRAPMIRSQRANLSTELGFESEQEQLDVISSILVPISLDRLRVIRATADGDASLQGGGYVSGQLTASFGLKGLGARRAADATALLPLSRQGTDADFRKLELSAAFEQPLGTHLQFEARLRAQTAFGKALSRIEQVGFASPDALSTSESGGFQGDSGFGMRIELKAPFVSRLPKIGLSVVPYVFSSHAEAQLADPTALEATSVRGNAYGLGVRMTGVFAPHRSFYLSAEWGRQNRSDGLRDPDRLRVSSWLQF